MKANKLLQLACRMPGYWLQRKCDFPSFLPTNLTLNVSYRCNSRCLTCNITKRVVNELSLAEWEKIFKNYKSKVFWLILSGGEPFLRPDFIKIVLAGYKYLQPAVINIPTNGMLYKSIPLKVEQILKQCPNCEVVVNFSLDGIGKDHDRIRGVPGNFEMLLKSYRGVKNLKNKYPNLSVGIHSVISKFNVKKIPQLCDFALSCKPDQYLTEIAEERVELLTMKTDVAPSLKEYKQVIDYVSKAISKHNFKGIAKKTEALRLAYYALVKRILKEKKQVIPCYAGWASAQISAEGEVWPCCVRADNMGNLRDFNYSFSKVWFGKKAREVKASIKNKECFCPLASASYTNMLFDLSSGLRIFKDYFKI